MIRLKHILLSLLIAVAFTAAGQSYVIDSVCVGADRHYRIDGELNSTYQWSLTDQAGIIHSLPETADTVSVNWNMGAGEYILSTVQTGIHGCDSLELGIVRVFDLPVVYAGEDADLCTGTTFTIENATASDYRNLLWTSSGDGYFDNASALNPVYTFGPDDFVTGYVTLTLSATGLGMDGSCPPVQSQVTLTFRSLTANLTVKDISCSGLMDGEIIIMNASGGSGSFEYSITNGTSWQSSNTFSGLSANTYNVFMKDANRDECSILLGTVEIHNPAEIVASISSVPSGCGQSDGEITITSSGGTGTHVYMISGLTSWQTSNQFNGLASGPYNVLVRDSNGCEKTIANIVVPASNGPSVVEVSTTPATNGQANGIAEVIADSPFLPLQYSLNGIVWQASDTFNGLLPDDYTAYIKDAQNCITSYPFTIQHIIDGEVQLMADRLIGCVNTSMDIPVYAYDFTGISAFTITLTFDPGVIEFTGLTNFNTQIDPSLVNTTVTVPGEMKITYTTTGTTTIPGGDQLFSFGFNTIAAGNTNLEWQYLQCRIYIAQGYEIPAILTPGLATVLPSPVFYADGSGVYCEEDVVTLHAGSLDSQALQFEWTGPSGFVHHGSDWQLGRLGMNDNGDYQLTATNPDFCNATKSLSVKVNPKPVIYLGYADTICFGQQVLLDPGSGYASYLWQDGSTEQSQIIYEEGVYWVQVVDTNSCRAMDTVQVMPCNIELLLPNAFSPNADGLNDVFKPIFSGFEPSDYLMTIYTKWGQRIFSSNDVNVGWDGTIDGSPAPLSVYVYVISFEAPSYVTRSIPSPVTGNIAIIK